jgi:hypothetical protein
MTLKVSSADKPARETVNESRPVDVCHLMMPVGRMVAPVGL